MVLEAKSTKKQIFLYLWHDLVCHVRNKSFRSFKSIDIFQGLQYLPGRHPFGVHADNFLVDGRNIFLAFLYDFGRECGLTVLRDVDVHTAITGTKLFGFVTVAIIVTVQMLLAPGCNNHFLPDKLNQF